MREPRESAGMHKFLISQALMGLSAVFLGQTVPAIAAPDRDLKIVSVDVEGGAAVLFRTPEGKSVLIDTGWKQELCNAAPVALGASKLPCPVSADQIAKAAQSLGVAKLDYLIMTHYHADHVGGLDALLAKMPVDTFVDHGPNREFLPTEAPARARANSTEVGYADWVAVHNGHHHITAHVGQRIHVGSMQIEFVASDGQLPDKPLPGAGQPNPLCAGVQEHEKSGGEENVRSLGMLITFGKTRILYLGDLTWNMELKLLCPVNKIGKTDIYFITGHGMNLSSSPPTAALDPIVAVMQNGPTKGGDQEVIKTVESYPDLKGFWRTHYSVRYPDLNGDPNYIANLNVVPDASYPINLDISLDGNITVTNSRNGYNKTYHAQGTD